MLLLVILFWLCVFGYIPYHFRNIKLVREFFQGFAGFWLSIIHAEDRMPDYDSNASDYGGIYAFVSAILAAILLLVAAGYTIYLAS